ncbi:MAG TPA: DNA-3-methyladenine glycosylase I [Patescibacteria group bacterium]|nr:DNA-3-methyladenine glycosylase I [Patescibacteria group bacterium]
MSSDGRVRCWGEKDPLMLRYHDEEWGVPLHDDRGHFEILVLEGAQAGLSWRTVLNRREGYRKAFQGFDPAIVAEYTPKKIDKLLLDPGIIRNRRKVESAVRNAGAFLRVQEEYGSFDEYVWGFVGGKPVMNAFTSWSELLPETEVSKAMSKDLKRRGFNFVGPTICYAYMQSIGMVNDHLTGCFRWQEIVDEYGH